MLFFIVKKIKLWFVNGLIDYIVKIYIVVLYICIYIILIRVVKGYDLFFFFLIWCCRYVNILVIEDLYISVYVI